MKDIFDLAKTSTTTSDPCAAYTRPSMTSLDRKEICSDILARMDWLKPELGTFMALQLACGAISDTRLTVNHDDFWKQLRVLSVLLECHLDKSSTILKSYDDGKHISKLAEECLRSAWTYVTELYRMPRAEARQALRVPPARNLLDTRFLLPLWLARNTFARSSITEIPTKSKELTTIDSLLSTLIGDYTNESKFPDLLPTDVMDRYHDSSKTDTTTRALRRKNIETYDPFDQRELFYGISEPCPGTLDWAIGATTEHPRSELTSGETLIAWLKHCDYSNNICWISGDPGSGKSVLMKHLVTRARSDPSLFEPHPRHARRDNNMDGQKPAIIIWHHFRTARVPVSMQREELTMIQNVLFQLFKQFPEEINRVFAYTYNMMLRQRKPDYIRAGFSTLKFKILENTLLLFLTNTGPVRPRVFIFLDEPSGFSREKSAFFNLSEVEDSPFIYKLKGVMGVKVCVASRPGGMFRDWDCSFHGREERGYRFPTLQMRDCVREDIKTSCIKRLESVPLPLRLPLAASIAKKSDGLFFIAKIECTAVLRAHEQPEDQGAGPSSFTYSHERFHSLLHEIERMPSTFKLPNYDFVQENRLETLSTYLNFIITHIKHNMSQARNQRPLSLLQFTLAVDSYRGILPSGPLTDFQMEFLARACDNIAHKIRKELYPFIVLREMEDQEKPRYVDENLAQNWKGLVRAAGSKVMLLHSNLVRFLEDTLAGEHLLEMAQEHGFAQRDCVATLLRASLFEHALLMPEKVTEECEEWLERGTGSEMKAEQKRRYPTTRSKTASTKARGMKPQPYRPYREHLKLLENLPQVAGLEGEMLLFEFWPSTFVQQIKIEPEESSYDGSGDDEVVRETKRRRMA